MEIKYVLLNVHVIKDIMNVLIKYGLVKNYHVWIIYYIDGTVCAQDGSFISVESGCSHVGEIDICKGKVTGDCGCGTLTPTVTPTVPLGYCRDGERFCNSQCECGKGYYECAQGRWIERPLPSIF